MQLLLYILVIVIILDKTVLKSKRSKKSQRNIQIHKPPIYQGSNTYNNQISYAGQYTKVPLLTNREQKQYEHLKLLADEKKVLICPKVRMLDLVTPIHGVKNYKTLLSKVMSKHVDFVICDQRMQVLGIIELDDSTHLRKDRIERDEFVDTVLKSAGYKIKHTLEITSNILDSFLDDNVATHSESKIISPTGWIWNETRKLWEPPEYLK